MASVSKLSLTFSLSLLSLMCWWCFVECAGFGALSAISSGLGLCEKKYYFHLPCLHDNGDYYCCRPDLLDNALFYKNVFGHDHVDRHAAPLLFLLLMRSSPRLSFFHCLTSVRFLVVLWTCDMYHYDGCLEGDRVYVLAMVFFTLNHGHCHDEGIFFACVLR